MGLSEAPGTFVHLMHHVLRPYIGVFVVVYFDDILVFSKTMKEHINHVKSVMRTSIQLLHPQPLLLYILDQLLELVHAN